ncbi:MAG: EamA family transporter [Clostridia bacterium]|nr:EamA family transporter [Clostridia bacterium]
MSCGVAYTFQVIGQKDTHPTVASILMSLECVFAVLGGALLLSQIPTTSEIFGCILMLAATILSQVDIKKKAK